MRHYILEPYSMALGDCISLTGLVHAICEAGHKVSVRGPNTEEVFANNPYITRKFTEQALVVKPDYRPIARNLGPKDKTHYLEMPYITFEELTGISNLKRYPPELYLTDKEKTPNMKNKYWVVLSGTKVDMPSKQWPRRYFQEVINTTSKEDNIKWIQLGQIRDKRHSHYQHKVHGAVNKLGSTDIRSLFSYIANAQGVLCHVSAPMLIALAFKVPCVVVAGGRETPSYVDMNRHSLPTVSTPIRQTFIHSVGKLDCCQEKGCGCYVVKVPHNDSSFPDGYLCERPVAPKDKDEMWVGACMDMIKPQEVIQAIRGYLP